MRSIRKVVFFAVLATLVAPAALAISVEEANEFYTAQNWAKAERAYRSLVKNKPKSTFFKYRLAVSLRNQGEYDEASEWLDQSKGGLVPDAYVDLERARVLTAKGDSSGAMGALRAAADGGFANAAALAEDQALEGIRGEPGYEEVIAKMEKNRVPCEHVPEYDQFDFWLGEWRVVDPAGTFQGTNKIEKTQGGCLILENWVGAGGTPGTSMNYYDLHAKEWVQVWISPMLQLDIRGGIVDGSMVLTGNVYQTQSGTYSPFRGTWTPMEDGVVRQLFEQSSDGGKTWTTVFDGRYHRVTDEDG
jgi:hypothetical protein